MPVGSFYDEATDHKPIRRFKRRRKFTPPKGEMVEVGRNVFAVDKSDHRDHPSKINPANGRVTLS